MHYKDIDKYGQMIKEKKENRAWFISEDGRAPLYFYVMFDRKKSGFSEIDFKMGEKVDLGDKDAIYYNVEPTKYGTEEYIRKWDFLPNSADVPLANEKALKVLEEVASGDFQAIPTKIIMPDGKVIEDYKLINITNRVSALDREKSIPEEERYQSEVQKYKEHYYKLLCLGDENLCRVDEKCLFLASEKLRNAVKSAKLVGLQFRNTYGRTHFFLDENGEIPESHRK